jgi:HAD superfamily hydrolase (TIGR01509 family)
VLISGPARADTGAVRVAVMRTSGPAPRERAIRRAEPQQVGSHSLHRTFPAGVILDLDGTLMDTAPIRVEAWAAALTEAGVMADRASIARRIGMDGHRLAGEIAAIAGMRLDMRRRDKIDQAAGRAFDRLNIDRHPLPGARQLLAALRASAIPWAIATSSRREQVASSLARLELAGSEVVVVDGADVVRAKPAPDLLLAAAFRLGVAPERCWYVGDSAWDVHAARGAGMRAIVVTAGSVADLWYLQAAVPDLLVPTLREVSLLLRRS